MGDEEIVADDDDDEGNAGNENDAGDEAVRGLRRLGFAATMRPFAGVGHTVSPAMRAVLFDELRRAVGNGCGG
jgi:hypothetical protein